MIVNISEEVYKKCEDFSIKRIVGSEGLYSYRGESRKEKMIEDVLVGTLGEWAVEAHLKSLGYDCSEPDMNIYDKKKKSFSADLYVDDFKIHVKSQGLKSAKRYGNSWLLQKKDSVVSCPEDRELFAFTCVEPENRVVDILGYCWAKDMKYGECKVWSYRKTKVAIYLKDVEDRLIEF